MKSTFIALHNYSQKQVFTKTGQADALANHHRLQTIGRKCFMELRQHAKRKIEKEKSSVK
jgi:hypothetical protein